MKKLILLGISILVLYGCVSLRPGAKLVRIIEPYEKEKYQCETLDIISAGHSSGGRTMNVLRNKVDMKGGNALILRTTGNDMWGHITMTVEAMRCEFKED